MHEIEIKIEGCPNTERKVEAVKKQARFLAQSVIQLLGIPKTEKYLETIYIPFLSHFMQLNEILPLKNVNGVIFNDFDDFYNFGFGLECQGPQKKFEQKIKYKQGSYDIIFPGGVNAYEKLVYLICGISFSVLGYYDASRKSIVAPDVGLRAELKDLIDNADIFSDSNIIDFLPISLLEGLAEKKYVENYPASRYHWLGPIRHEDYLFFLAHLKEKGTIIIGQPHGGAYCQMASLMGTEIAERALVDIFHSPLWRVNANVFSNWRASRNLFLALKYFTFRKPKKKMLVLLSYFYTEEEPRQNKIFTGETPINDFYHSKLRELKEHFDIDLDFKIYPRQDVGFIKHIDYLKQMYPDTEFVTSGMVQEVAHRYEGVIHMDTWGTAIMELAGTNIAQYVYLGPEILINSDYKFFLWGIRDSSTRSTLDKGTWVKINNTQFKRAYGASYFYPFRITKLLRHS